VGQNTEPTPNLTIGCQEVFFLNDADFLDGGACPTNRPERIRPVTLNLQAPYGTSGTLTISAQGTANPVVCYVENDVTNRITGTTVLPLAVTDPFTRMGVHTICVSCPQTGTGTLTATVSLDGGGTLSDTASFKCIEPLRKLVTTEKDAGRFINPSRLVMGTNAVLQVGVNGDFDATNVQWRVVSGSADISPMNGFTTTVVPTGTNEDVVVEARFNGDEIQPSFKLPVVMPRTIPLKTFIVKPPQDMRDNAWLHSDVSDMLDTANEIFTQVGIRFEMVGVPQNIDATNNWIVPMCNVTTNIYGEVSYSEYVTSQMMTLLNNYKTNDCVEVYFVGGIVNPSVAAITTEFGVIIGRTDFKYVLAHELGHTLGLKDVCHSVQVAANGTNTIWSLGARLNPLDKHVFTDHEHDWRRETGRGFYENCDTIASTIDMLLMLGVESSTSTNNVIGDIPSGKVYGLSKILDKDHQNVGASGIEPSNEKVYSK
jgi:hypothetical protein